MNMKFLLPLISVSILLIGRVSDSNAQMEIAVFSKMVDVQEIATSEEQADKRYPALENLVRALRSYQGMAGKKEFTIFVPNNEAFKKVPKGTLDYFTKSENKHALEELVSFHALEQKLSRKDILSRIEAGNGKAILKTISGFKLTATADKEGNILLANEVGKQIAITAYNYHKGNGLVHVVSSVIIPYDHGLAEEEMVQALK
jgi:uncharacterized surface protein with fasciclin (FAS1) repeats